MTSLVASAISQKSCRFWLCLLLPLLSSGHPGCPCVHGAGMTVGGTVHGRVHPGPSQGCSGHAGAGWRGFFSPGRLKNEAVRADRQSWFLGDAKPAVGGRRRVQQSGEGWQGGPAVVTNTKRIPPGRGCGCALHRHPSGEQPLGRCRVLVSAFTRAPAARPALNQLLELTNPFFGQVSRKKNPLSASFPLRPWEWFDPGWFLAATLP